MDTSFLRKFQNKNLIQCHLAAIVGFVIGAKICDYILFDWNKYEIQREELEDNYWKKFGEPKILKPYMVPSLKSPTEMRKSWIFIMYEKDNIIPVNEELD